MSTSQIISYTICIFLSGLLNAILIIEYGLTLWTILFCILTYIMLVFLRAYQAIININKYNLNKERAK